MRESLNGALSPSRHGQGNGRLLTPIDLTSSLNINGLRSKSGVSKGTKQHMTTAESKANDLEKSALLRQQLSIAQIKRPFK